MKAKRFVVAVDSSSVRTTGLPRIQLIPPPRLRELEVSGGGSTGGCGQVGYR